MKEGHDDPARSGHRPFPSFDDSPLRHSSFEQEDHLEFDSGLEIEDDLDLEASQELRDDLDLEDGHELAGSQELEHNLDLQEPPRRQRGADLTGGQTRPYFSNFDPDSEDEYEEPDRDIDYAFGFREEALDEEEAFESLLPKELQEDSAALFEEQENFLTNEVEATFRNRPTENELPEANTVPNAADRTDEWEDDDADSPSWQSVGAGGAALSEDWSDDDYAGEEDERSPSPLVPLLVGAVALLLIIAGVYGVVQQRMETQEQIRQLQASLATTASPEELAASRTALQEAKERNNELSFEVSSLQQDNQRLADKVGSLESQLQALRTAALEATAKSEPATPAAAAAAPVKAEPPQAAPATTAEPAPVQAAAAPALAEGWFVNFGSYGQEAVAREWATRLRPDAGEVIVAPSVKDGRTFYRVRVVGLGNREAAQQTAQKLQSTYGLPKLWIGQQ